MAATSGQETTDVVELERQLRERMDELRPVAWEFVRLWALLDAIDGREVLPVPAFLEPVVAISAPDPRHQRAARERQQQRMTLLVPKRR